MRGCWGGREKQTMKVPVGPFRAMAVLNSKSSGTLMEASRQEGAMLRSVS